MNIASLITIRVLSSSFIFGYIWIVQTGIVTFVGKETQITVLKEISENLEKSPPSLQTVLVSILVLWPASRTTLVLTEEAVVCSRDVLGRTP